MSRSDMELADRCVDVGLRELAGHGCPDLRHRILSASPDRRVAVSPGVPPRDPGVARQHRGGAAVALFSVVPVTFR